MAIGDIIINGDISYINQTPTMTSDTTPIPYIITGSKESSEKEFYLAFDSDEYSCWGSVDALSVTCPAWIQIDMSKKVFASHVCIRGRNSTITPNNIKILGSNDGMIFDTIVSYSNIVSTGSPGTFIDFGKVVNYRYYKLEIYNVAGGISKICGISDFKILLNSSVKPINYLIKDKSNNKYYNYDNENDSFIEVAESNVQTILENLDGFDDIKLVLSKISNNSSNVSLISNLNTRILINGIKNNKELIISNQNLSIVNAETIHNFLFEVAKVTNGNCKFVISADNGQTWISWNGSSWDTLINTAPLDENNKIKQYSKLSDSEKIQWNKLKDEIWISGMNTDITDVDYNSILTNKTIRFAFVLYRPSYEDNVTLTDTKWLYDKIGSWHKLSEDDIDIAINSNMCTVTPKLQNLTNVKVNILL